MNKGACAGCESLRFGEIEGNQMVHFAFWSCKKLGKLFGKAAEIQVKFPSKCRSREEVK